MRRSPSHVIASSTSLSYFFAVSLFVLSFFFLLALSSLCSSGVLSLSLFFFSLLFVLFVMHYPAFILVAVSYFFNHLFFSSLLFMHCLPFFRLTSPFKHFFNLVLLLSFNLPSFSSFFFLPFYSIVFSNHNLHFFSLYQHVFVS